MPDAEFKIIALQPLEHCKEDYHKILTKGETYFFYQNYKIDVNESLIMTAPALPKDFFCNEKPLVEINAIVGKNGSGKSTLMELFLMAVNNYVAQLKYVSTRMIKIQGIHVQIYFKFNGFRKLVVSDEGIQLYKFSVKANKMVLDEQPSLEPFFYTIAVNYSHYAYNDLEYAKDQRWLSNVFHKNDGYQIPIVLNPFRNNGNIDINVENILIYARLMANLLRPSTDGDFDFRKLTEKARAIYLKLSLNISKSGRILYEGTAEGQEEPVRVKDLRIDRDFILDELDRLYPFKRKKKLTKEHEYAIEYIFYKLVTICLRYPAYQQFFDKAEKRFKESTLQQYLQTIINDPSHIAFKLKQTLNYIAYDHLEQKSQRLDLDSYGKTIYKLMQRNAETRELIEFLPPPIFKTEIMLRNTDSGKVSSFSHLSSGEKQWDYAVSSFLYHLNNLDSIPPKKNRITYSRVFITLEEVELYFHPEMQRRYLQHVIDCIRQLNFRHIKRIQICFVTHSPFILSDIPEQNILFLGKDGLPAAPEYVTKTFGGNIHELLAKSFFLDDALVGEHARRKIKEIIRQVQPDQEISIDKTKLPLLRQQIDLIGEEYLREKLVEMYDEKFSRDENQLRIKELEAEIRRLRNDRT